MRDARNLRLLVAGLLIATLAAGLWSRSGANPSPWLRDHAGDALWALAVFWGWALLLPASPAWKVAALAIATAVAVELGQLIQTPWLDRLRSTRLGALVLGHGFLWIDLVRYVAGVLVGWSALAAIRRR